MSKLLTEMVQEDVQYLVENTGVEKTYYIHGIFMQANKKNRNGRVYPKELLQREVARYNVNYVQQNRAFSELGHPESPTINLDRVSHMIKELHEDGDNFIGKAKIMDTPYGKIAKNFIDEGAKLGVSSRGLGSLENQNGVNIVQNDFFLSAIDIVADPSASDAFVRGIMENAEWTLENGKWVQMAKKAITEAHRADREEITLRLFEKLLRKI